MNIVYFSLGANLGNREQTIEQAIALMQQRVGKLLRQSAYYYSEPWGFQSEHSFCNICASFETHLSPEQLLTETQAIEKLLGRTTKTNSPHSPITTQDKPHEVPAYHDRTIDIDLLQYFDTQHQEIKLQTQLLTLPHPLMQERDFVRIPLQEIIN